ncbi:MAG: HAMP domain-containing histidine kinase [Chitinophagales bacterium]|nr:HAMP domain-containing histidine kinase [Chitinophagales bacterium]
MKLITKTGIYFTLISLLLFVLGGGIFYYSLQHIIDEEIIEIMEADKEQVLRYIQSTGNIPAKSPINADNLIFLPVDVIVAEEIRDTLLYNSFEDEILPYRELIFPVRVKDQNYAVVIRKLLFESADLIESVIIALVIILPALIILLFIASILLSKRMWTPFYNTLHQLRNYDISKAGPVEFSTTSVDEFKQLNADIKKMTDKMQSDYQNLKEFSENASHEIQTPLAVMRSKLELIMQSETLKEEEIKLIQDAYESVNRLSKLNQSLLLLSKIENRQFHDTADISLKEFIEKKLEHFAEIIQFKNITVEQDLHNGFTAQMNPYLADILFSNIISNAIRHNTEGGKIIVMLRDKTFTISNTGKALTMPPEKLFERFSKGETSSESPGLGLAIAKQICDTYSFKIDYFFISGMHTITIHF